MNEINVNQLLVQMRAMAEKTQGVEFATQQTGVNKVGPDSEFSSLLKSSVEKVNEAQKNAGDLATRFTTGDANVNLTDVMINLQKASLSFQAMTQVRNRLVSAYQEVMNMQI